MANPERGLRADTPWHGSCFLFCEYLWPTAAADRSSHVDLGRSMRLHRFMLLPSALLGFALGLADARAGSLQVVVTANSAPAQDAVVSLHSPQAAVAVKPTPATIDQRNTQFTPRISVVHVGSPIRFPNSDNVRHQVYSFSPARRFELPLYSGKSAPPIVFDKPGVVELGCNIHDWMLAYVVVVDTPYHGVTDIHGLTTIEAPPGDYRMRVWHPNLAPGSPASEQGVTIGKHAARVGIALELVDRAAPAAPSDDKLRALQEKFRKLKDRK